MLVLDLESRSSFTTLHGGKAGSEYPAESRTIIIVHTRLLLAKWAVVRSF